MRKSGEALPRLLLIADGFAAGHATPRETWPPHLMQLRAFAAAAAGVPWVQLRDHEASGERFGREAERFRDDVARLPVLLSVNTHVDVARRLGTGLHVGRRGPSVAEARAMLPGAVLSAAVHSAEEAVGAAEAGADAVLFSPVFATTSKPGRAGAGLYALAECCAAVPGTPVIALGGVTPARVAGCLAAGAHGVAVLSGILFPQRPGDIFDAVQSYRAALGLPIHTR